MVILITEPKDYSGKALAIYKSLGEVYFLPDLVGGLPMSQILQNPAKRGEAGHQKSKILEVLDKTNVLVVRLAYKIDKSWLDKMPNLKMIATPTTGLNHIDVAEAEKRCIKIIALRGHTEFLDKITSTAEETIGLMIALIRKLSWAFDYVKSGGWVDRDRFRGHQLAGKTLGILGLGRLGKMVARYSKAMDMRVLACDPNVSETEMQRLSAGGGTSFGGEIKKVSQEELFRQSDILSIHILLTDSTRDLVNEEHFKLMKPSAYFINTARAEIIAEGVLEKALEEKWIAGAAVDVMWGEEGGLAFEKGLRNNRLWNYAKNHENLIIVPHIGGATHEAMAITEDFVAELVKQHFGK